MLILLIFYVAAGLLLCGLAVPLILGKIGPNPLYGFRVQQTLENPAIWYPVNAYSGKALLAVGLGIVLTAPLLYIVPGIDIAVYACSMAAVALVSLVVSIGLSFRYLGKVVARERAGSSGSPA
jgi:hypothetical protein